MINLRTLVYLGLAACLIVFFILMRSHYIDQGIQQERARNDAATVESMREMLTAHQALIDSANRASLDMQNAITARNRADAQTTRSLKNALSKTAADRAGCVFDPDSLRHLDDARTRAAEAATRGLRATAPRTPAQDGRHPG